MFGTPFEIFGTVHVITIVVIAFVSIFLPKFYKDPELRLKLSDNSSELCNSLSGENKFKKNWERIEEMLYE